MKSQRKKRWANALSPRENAKRVTYWRSQNWSRRWPIVSDRRRALL